MGAEAAEGCGHLGRSNSNFGQTVPPRLLLRLSAAALNLSELQETPLANGANNPAFTGWWED